MHKNYFLPYVTILHLKYTTLVEYEHEYSYLNLLFAKNYIISKPKIDKDT